MSQVHAPVVGYYHGPNYGDFPNPYQPPVQFTYPNGVPMMAPVQNGCTHCTHPGFVQPQMGYTYEPQLPVATPVYPTAVPVTPPPLAVTVNCNSPANGKAKSVSLDEYDHKLAEAQPRPTILFVAKCHDRNSLCALRDIFDKANLHFTFAEVMSYRNPCRASIWEVYVNAKGRDYLTQISRDGVLNRMGIALDD